VDLVTPSSTWSAMFDPPDAGWTFVPGPDESLAAWCAHTCERLDATGGSARRLSRELEQAAVQALAEGFGLVALWVPHRDHGVLATLTLDAFDEGGFSLEGTRPAPWNLEALRDLENGLGVVGLVAPEVTLVELPAGEAVRARRVITVGDLRGRVGLGESVAYTWLPEPAEAVSAGGLPEAVRLTVTWRGLGDSDGFCELADEAAAGLSVVPAAG
jgi:hypothetical protein